MKRIIGVGSALLDILARVPESFLEDVPGDKGGMVLFDDAESAALLKKLPGNTSRVPGGSAANTIMGAAKLGLPGRMLAKIGADEAGELYCDHAESSGVDRLAFKINPQVPTGTCISLVTPDSERTMRTNLGASATLELDEVSVADFAACDHVHLEGYLLFNRDLLMHVLKVVKEAGCTTSLDLAAPEVVQAGLDILPGVIEEYIDMVFANEKEAEVFTGTADEEEALRKISRICDVAVVKLGARGALLKQADEVVKVALAPVEAVDTTGAGDLWAAGFLYGYLTGKSLEKSALLGAHVAAEVVQVMGASIPEDRWKLLREIAK